MAPRLVADLKVRRFGNTGTIFLGEKELKWDGGIGQFCSVSSSF
jgi:hypothetical protein